MTARVLPRGLSLSRGLSRQASPFSSSLRFPLRLWVLRAYKLSPKACLYEESSILNSPPPSWLWPPPFHKTTLPRSSETTCCHYERRPSVLPWPGSRQHGATASVLRRCLSLAPRIPHSPESSIGLSPAPPHPRISAFGWVPVTLARWGCCHRAPWTKGLNSEDLLSQNSA